MSDNRRRLAIAGVAFYVNDGDDNINFAFLPNPRAWWIGNIS